MAAQVKYIWPIQQAVTDFGAQRKRLKLVRQQLGWRLLGCDLTYHGSLPLKGDTVRYDIHVDGHAVCQQLHHRIIDHHRRGGGGGICATNRRQRRQRRSR